MGLIPSELTSFRDKMSKDELGKMKTSASDVSSQLATLKSSNATALSGIDTYYASTRKASLSNVFNKIDEFCAELDQSVTSDVSKLVSESTTLIDEVNDLETREKAIEELKNAINITTDKEKRRVAEENLTRLKNEFDLLLDTATNRLANLKGFSGSLTEFNIVDDISTEVKTPSGTEFCGYTTINVNGKAVRCFLYVPKFDDPEYKAPIIQYMYGINMESHGEHMATDSGLGYMIEKENFRPGFAVCVPVVNSGWDYENDAVIDSFAELPFALADQYGLDANRVSLAGTSYGGIAAYEIAKRNPGQFAALLSAYGTEDVDESFADLGVVINYTGQGGETERTNIKNIKANSDKINAYGGNSIFKAYEGTWNHTDTGNRALKDTVVGDDGVERSTLEELTRHVRKNVA